MATVHFCLWAYWMYVAGTATLTLCLGLVAIYGPEMRARLAIAARGAVRYSATGAAYAVLGAAWASVTAYRAIVGAAAFCGVLLLLTVAMLLEIRARRQQNRRDGGRGGSGGTAAA